MQCDVLSICYRKSPLLVLLKLVSGDLKQSHLLFDNIVVRWLQSSSLISESPGEGRSVLPWIIIHRVITTNVLIEKFLEISIDVSLCCHSLGQCRTILRMRCQSNQGGVGHMGVMCVERA